MRILVTGGAGYIGTHSCVELLNAGFEVTVFDNFCNSHPEALARVERITGKPVDLVRGDVRDRAALVAALRESGASAVIHFAGLKAVGESVAQPLIYYDNNVVGTLRLLEAMDECAVKTLVFSSSATVYGDPQRLPLSEDHPLSATNPYGRSKLMIEDVLRDLSLSDASWRLRRVAIFQPGRCPRQRTTGALPHCRTPPRRYRRLLRRSEAGPGSVGLESRARAGSDVRRRLALAERESEWVRGVK